MNAAMTRRVKIAAMIVFAVVIVVVILVIREVSDTGETSPGEPDSGSMDSAPLTGLPIDANLDRPAVAIKVSDVRSAHPQWGVDRADIVFVEPIGVSYTRLAAVFHSDLPDTVGPVRSIRPMDAPLLGPLAPVFGNTMGAQWVMDYVDSEADLDDLGTLRVRGSDAYFTDPQRPEPDHVFARPTELLELSTFTDPPEPYFTYRADADAGSAASASGPGQRVDVPYGPEWNVSWTYDQAAGQYLRSQPWGSHTTADGVQVAAVNVVVLNVESQVGKLGSGGGAPVPILELVDSSGPLVALSGGQSVTGTWSKGGVNDPFEFRTDAGEELRLAPGNTWVELPGASAAVTTG